MNNSTPEQLMVVGSHRNKHQHHPHTDIDIEATEESIASSSMNDGDDSLNDDDHSAIDVATSRGHDASIGYGGSSIVDKAARHDDRRDDETSSGMQRNLKNKQIKRHRHRYRHGGGKSYRRHCTLHRKSHPEEYTHSDDGDNDSGSDINCDDSLSVVVCDAGDKYNDIYIDTGTSDARGSRNDGKENSDDAGDNNAAATEVNASGHCSALGNSEQAGDWKGRKGRVVAAAATVEEEEEEEQHEEELSHTDSSDRGVNATNDIDSSAPVVSDDMVSDTNPNAKLVIMDLIRDENSDTGAY